MCRVNRALNNCLSEGVMVQCRRPDEAIESVEHRVLKNQFRKVRKFDYGKTEKLKCVLFGISVCFRVSFIIINNNNNNFISLLRHYIKEFSKV